MTVMTNVSNIQISRIDPDNEFLSSNVQFQIVVEEQNKECQG